MITRALLTVGLVGLALLFAMLLLWMSEGVDCYPGCSDTVQLAGDVYVPVAIVTLLAFIGAAATALARR